MKYFFILQFGIDGDAETAFALLPRDMKYLYDLIITYKNPRISYQTYRYNN